MASRSLEFLVNIVGDASKLGAAAREGGSEVEQAIGRIDLTEAGQAMADTLKKGLLSVGIGAALADGISDNLDIEQAASKVEARLDLTAEEAERVGRLGADLYRNAWGESTDETIAAIGRVGQGLVDLSTVSDEELQAITANALDVAEAFDQDVNEVIRSAEQLLRNDLAGSAQEAMDIVARTFQMGGDEADDLADTIEEYSQHFAQMGFSGEEAMAMIVAALKDGQRDTDKLADAVKEFGIRAREDTEPVREAFEALGLEADEVQAKIGEGGPAARDAYQQVVEAILAVEDPLERQRVAVELFGTQMEDLGANAVQYLLPVEGGLDGVDGAAQRLSETLNDNAATNVEEFGRKLGAVSDVSTQQAAPAIGFLAEKGSEALDIYLELPGAVQGTVGALGGVTAVAVPLIDQLGDLSFNIRNIAGAADAAKAALSGAAGLAGTVALVGTAAFVAGGLYMGFKETLSGPDNTFGGEVDNLRDLIDQLGELEGTLQFLTGQVDDDELRGMFIEAGVEVDELAAKLNAGEQEWDAYKDTVAEAAAESSLNLFEQQALKRVLEDLREASADAKSELDELGQVQGEGAGAAAELADEQLLAAQNTDAAGGAAGDAIGPYLEYQGAMEAATEAARDQAEAEREAEQALRDHIDAVFELANEQIAAREAQRRTADAVDDYLETVDDAEASTRDIEAAQDDAAQAALRQAEAVLAAEAASRGLETAELDAATAAQIQVTELGKVASTLAPGSALRSQLEGYISDITGIPEEMVTEFLASIDEEGFAEAEARLANLARLRTARITAEIVPGAGAGALLNDTQLVLAEPRASGGPIAAGRAYLVGEDGPELRVFGEGGSIVDAETTGEIMRNLVAGKGTVAERAALGSGTVAGNVLAAKGMVASRADAGSVLAALAGRGDRDWGRSFAGWGRSWRDRDDDSSVVFAEGAIQVFGTPGQDVEDLARRVGRIVREELNRETRRNGRQLTGVKRK